MPRIFISYRRADSQTITGRIYDRLVTAFGPENVFKDVQDIKPGSDFRGALKEAVGSCDVLLVVIGKDWLTSADSHGNRRLDNPGDFVRIEIETGLQRDKVLVVPVLIDKASMPSASDLPVELHELAFKQAVDVREDPDFHLDMTRLLDHLKDGAPDTEPPARTSSGGNHRGMLTLTVVIALVIIVITGLVISSLFRTRTDPSVEAAFTVVTITFQAQIDTILTDFMRHTEQAQTAIALVWTNTPIASSTFPPVLTSTETTAVTEVPLNQP